MIIRDEYLVKINHKNRIQRVRLSLDYNEYGSVYSIYRITGQYGGKETEWPAILIKNNGKKKSRSDQAGYIFSSLLKKYLSTGYKRLNALTSKKYNDLTEEELRKILNGDFIANTKSIPKPMLAKNNNLCSTSILENEHYICPRVDGLRCLMYSRDGMIQAVNHKGKPLNILTTTIRNSELLNSLFNKNPDLILDGELTLENYSTSELNLLSKSKSYISEMQHVIYWIRDYISKELFSDRIKNITALHDLFIDESYIKVVPYKKEVGYLKVKTLHDNYVREGYEGIYIYNPLKPYGAGIQSSTYLMYMQSYTLEDFPIIDIVPGRRYHTVMLYLRNKRNRTFSVEPEIPEEKALEILSSKKQYIGKLCKCKFFYYDDLDLPVKPMFKCLQNE
jgi:hypothetical protein